MIVLLTYHIFQNFLRFAALCALALSLVVTGCGPKKQEAWNSYYYGMHQDNDDTYVAPTQGAWNDNQTPQGQRWK